MPAKQVYGKRATVKTTASFAKFISPDKDVIVVGERRKNATKPTRATKRDETKGEVEVEGLEKEMDGLKLVNEYEVVEERVEKKKRRAKRVVEEDEEELQEVEGPADVVNLVEDVNALALEQGGDEPQRKGNRKTVRPTKLPERINGPANAIDLASEMDALALEPDETKPQRTETRKNGRSKKVSEEIVGTKTVAKDAVRPQEQTIPPNPADRQSPPSAPVRGRRLKAVLVPKRTVSPKMSLLPTPEPTPEPEDPYTAYVSPLLSLSYGKNVISFDTWSSALEPHFKVTKIAEASYSEVYRLTAATSTSDSTNESVLKLVALKTPPNAPLPIQSQTRQVRDPERQAKKEREAREEQEEEDQWKSHVDDVHSEVKLLQNLNHIPGFTNFRELTVLQGRPSASFISAWKAWNKTRPRGKKSEFPDPSKKTSYEDTQLWAVIEMQDAGTDCEKVMEAGGMSTIWEVWDVFWGVCLSVAKAEEACNFEHRDLHLENICIRSSRSRSEHELTKPIIQDPLRRKLGFTGLDTTVIDYTLSRADILPYTLTLSSSPSSPASIASSSSASRPCTPSSKPEVAYLDLNKDLSLFAGDASEEYQYEIYRYMHGVVFHNDPLRSLDSTSSEPDAPPSPRRSPRKTPQHIRFDSSDTDAPPHRSLSKPTSKTCPPSDPWRAFHPKTNLVWAHFILYQLLEHLHGADPTKLSSEQVMENVEAKVEDTSRVVKKAYKLYKVLERVRVLLEPSALKGEGGLGSVKELVVLAMEERWLRVEDVAGA